MRKAEILHEGTRVTPLEPLTSPQRCYAEFNVVFVVDGVLLLLLRNYYYIDKASCTCAACVIVFTSRF